MGYYRSNDQPLLVLHVQRFNPLARVGKFDVLTDDKGSIKYRECCRSLEPRVAHCDCVCREVEGDGEVPQALYKYCGCLFSRAATHGYI